MMSTYRKSALLSILFLFALTLSAQIGVTALYNLNDGRQSVDNGRYEELVPFYANGPEVALNYWFRLPKRRIEFLPTLYYNQTSGDVGYTGYGFQFKTNIYVFDLATDCDCPTFGKQGPRLDKGFYLQLAPGVGQHVYEDMTADSRITTFSLAGGMGIDFGITNLLTITPQISVRHHFGDILDLDFTDEGNEPLLYDTRLTSYQVGLQATLRFDHKRY